MDLLSADCFDLMVAGRKRDTAMKVRPKGGRGETEVWCDMKAGGWTMLLRRSEASTNFDRTWQQYKTGFGQGGASSQLDTLLKHGQ